LKTEGYEKGWKGNNENYRGGGGLTKVNIKKENRLKIQLRTTKGTNKRGTRVV